MALDMTSTLFFYISTTHFLGRVTGALKNRPAAMYSLYSLVIFENLYVFLKGRKKPFTLKVKKRKT